jgi:hypothetical protein
MPEAKYIDLEELRKLANIGATQREIAHWFGLSVKRIEQLLKQPKYRQVYDTGRAQFHVSLRRTQVEKALAGNVTMLIWLGKQELGQKDMVINQNENTNTQTVNLNVHQSAQALLSRFAEDVTAELSKETVIEISASRTSEDLPQLEGILGQTGPAETGQ